jgi:hypothetical protein
MAKVRIETEQATDYVAWTVTSPRDLVRSFKVSVLESGQTLTSIVSVLLYVYCSSSDFRRGVNEVAQVFRAAEKARRKAGAEGSVTVDLSDLILPGQYGRE